MADGAAEPSRLRRSWPLAVGGLLLVLAGAIGYFVAVTGLGGRLPWVRNTALPSWILIGAGLALSILALRRSQTGWMPKLLLGVNVVLAGLFAAMIYISFVVPAGNAPALGVPAPDFALLDQHGETVRLSDLRGAPVLLVFYRGHW